MDKLTLQHLSGYLPYKLKVEWVREDDELIENELTISDYNFLVKTKQAKPILRPLSDLTKEIEVNGEKFVPVVELLKLEHPTQEKTGRYSEITVSENGFPNAFYTYQANRCLTVYTSHINSIPFWIIQKLLEWHFDIFGLLEKGFAIDINTLNK